MRLIIGLGNPGKKYAQTRHNLGFMVLDALGTAIAKKDNFLLVKPQTYMNLSGQAVAKIARYYKIKPEEILIIHDDKDLPFGKIRIRHKGSAGGHLGVQSVIDALKTDKFSRLKIGIGKPDIKNTEKFVLQKFSSEERKKLPEIINQAILLIDNNKTPPETYSRKKRLRRNCLFRE